MRDGNDETPKVMKTKGKTMRDGNDETAKVMKAKGKTMSDEKTAKVTTNNTTADVTKGKTMSNETTKHEVTNGTTTTPALTTSAPLAQAPKWSDGFDDDDG
jgi:hypothetical protein